MEIKVVDGKLSIVSLFWPVAVGYAIGAGVFFVPMFLLAGLMFPFAPMVDQNGEEVVGAARFMPAMMAIMVPFIVAMQGAMMGGLVMLGLAIYRNWGSLRIKSVRETPEG